MVHMVLMMHMVHMVHLICMLQVVHFVNFVHMVHRVYMVHMVHMVPMVHGVQMVAYRTYGAHITTGPKVCNTSHKCVTLVAGGVPNSLSCMHVTDRYAGACSTESHGSTS